MAVLKIELAGYLENLVDDVAKLMGRSRTATLEALLYRVELLARNNKLTEAFGLDWMEAAAILNARGLGAKHTDPVMLAGGEHVAFDIELLEVSGKSRGGYTGVNATTGSSFRALVPDVEQGGTRYLASRPTSLEAAIDRYRWFERYGLAYGNLGRNVEHWKRMRPQWTMEEILVNLVEDASSAKDLKHPYTLAQAEHLLARLRERSRSTVHLGELARSASQALTETETPAVSEDVTILCSMCSEPIEDAMDLATWGKTPGSFSHKSCVPIA